MIDTHMILSFASDVRDFNLNATDALDAIHNAIDHDDPHILADFIDDRVTPIPITYTTA